MNDPITTIADTFVRLLRVELSPAAFAEMQRRNCTAPAGVCASHDFCDANVVMLAAFEAHELVPDMDDPTLWNAAWERAMPALSQTTHTIRWRLNDPGDENRQRWTRVHRLSAHAEDLTRCHIIIPEQPYMVDRDEQIPDGALACKRCATAGGIE
jgi:hypothetical protein